MVGMGRLTGKVAIVTGASRGTGEAVARMFVAEGASVVIGDLLHHQGKELADELGEQARYQHLDVTEPDSWSEAVEVTAQTFGPPTVLVNNAGVLRMASIEDHTVDDFDFCYRVNTLGPFLGTKAVIEPMKAAGSGSIINVTSIDSTKAKNGIAAYAASKWGARGLTKVAALELGRYGIRVNAVCPEAGSTSMVEPYIPSGVDAEWALSFSHDRLATQKARSQGDRLRDIAYAVTYLASDESGSTTGSDVVLDSGITAGTIIQGAPGA